VTKTSLPWRDAAGVAFLKPGFCFEPEHDHLFALGWPHLRFVDEAPLEDQKAVDLAVRVLSGWDRPPQLRWNRRLAQGLVRAWGAPATFELLPDARNLRPEAIEAVWEPRPLRPGEAAELLGIRMNTAVVGISDRSIETFVLLLEALVGSLEVAEAITTHLEQMPEPLASTQWSVPPRVTWQLGYLLLRVKPAEAAALRYRLEAVLARAPRGPKGGRAPWQDAASHYRALYFVLHGAEAARKSRDRNLYWYTHITDDANFVQMRVAMDTLSHLPDARLVFLGGHEVLRSYAKRWEQLKPVEQEWFWAQVEPIRSPFMNTLALEMSLKSAVRQPTTAWLQAHPEFTLDFLKKTAAGDGLVASHAAQVLKGM
jgi:hypothetical protein